MYVDNICEKSTTGEEVEKLEPLLKIRNACSIIRLNVCDIDLYNSWGWIWIFGFKRVKMSFISCDEMWFLFVWIILFLYFCYIVVLLFFFFPWNLLLCFLVHRCSSGHFFPNIMGQINISFSHYPRRENGLDFGGINPWKH